MQVKISENRYVDLDGTAGTQNENIATELEFEFPEKYGDYDKKIVFVIDDNTVKSDVLSSNTYKLKRDITKYKKVKCYISFFNAEGEDFRSVEFPLTFNTNHEATDEVSEEETSVANTLISTLNVEINKVSELQEKYESEIQDVSKVKNEIENYFTVEYDEVEEILTVGTAITYENELLKINV